MPVFHNINGKLKKLAVVPLNREKALQRLIEDNLLEVLGMKLLSSEYSTTHGGRIDTLAIDSNGTPVLIEYKRNINDSVISQALFYLEWLKSQTIDFYRGLIKAKFELEDFPKIDWRNPKAICIAENYNKYDIIGFKSVPGLELYRFHFYESNIFTLEKVNSEDDKPQTVQNNFSIKEEMNYDNNSDLNLTKAPIDGLKSISDINIEKQLKTGQGFIKILFTELEKKIKELDERIEEKGNTNNIVFRITKIFAEVHIQMETILIHLEEVEHDYPEEIVRPVPKKHGWGKKMSVRIKSEEELNYIMPLITKSYNSTL